MAGFGGGGYDDDDWGLSAEQLDQLERDAYSKLAERKASSSAASTAPATSPLPSRARAPEAAAYSSPVRNNQHPAARVALDSCFGKGNLSKASVHLFLHSTGVIAAKFQYHQKLVDAVHKIPKASWNGKERVWMFPPSSLSIAEEVLNTVPGIAVEVQNLDPLVKRALTAALSVRDLRDLYAKIPTDVESKLMPFQREGVRFALQHGARTLIADEMGLGKTLQVVLPQIGGSNKAGYRLVYSNTKGDFHLDGVFNVISYDVVSKIKETLLDLDFKIIIADESHFLKNAQAKRTTHALPILQLQALYPTVYRNVNEYGNRYCKGGFFGLYQGASNHEELHNLMKATVMIRRLKKDVLSQLPVKRRQQVFLDLSEKEMRHIRALFHELETVKIKIQSCDSKETMDSLKFAQKNLINKIYNDSAEAKIPAVLDYLGTMIEADCKFLIFAHHQPMLEAIHQHLLKKKVKCIRIDGQTPVPVRQTLVTDFQNKDDIKAAVLSIKAGGVGLTLTAASTVIFAELSWTPGDLIQAEDRAHRIGQVSSVNIYYLLANDTVDDIIWDVVQGKLENLGQMLDGQEKTLDVSQSETRPSPSKQKTLDSYLKRCSNSTEAHPKPKNPRF
uniref:Helicase C-terminal domain-containing protein n=1 Tax=Leersia perrieri TaxID=77586 RepID=A0A0D9X1X8_9ORYZ